VRAAVEKKGGNEGGHGENYSPMAREFACFAELLAVAVCADADRLPRALEWVEGVNAGRAICAADAYKRNNKAMMLASKRDDVEAVTVFYATGYRLRSRLASRRLKVATSISLEKGDASDEEYDQAPDVVAELDAFSALARPAYIIAEATVDQSLDPVHDTFSHLQTCLELRESMRAFSNKLDAVRDCLEAFSVALLDACAGQEQVEMLLGRDDFIAGLSVKAGSDIPRIYQAIQLDHRLFVTHDNSQQIIRKVFYSGPTMSKRRPLLTFLTSLVMIPVYSLAFIAQRVLQRCRCLRPRRRNSIAYDDEDEDEQEPNCLASLANHFSVPANRMVANFSCLFFFIVWIVLTLINPSDNPDKIDGNFYDIAAALWVVGYIASDVQMMCQLADSVRCKRNATVYKRFGVKLKKFFSNAFFDYRLFSHLIYFSGMLTEYSGYHLERRTPVRPLPLHLPNEAMTPVCRFAI